ncbi:c-type cytochrome [Aequorivita viscosa]|uniref:Nitric oxide reductase, NorC subunit apoprotein n=1 Tax=Aequorivita viscosa TaxID=797419 RepID=A0A1M6GUQ8_9FLAO|nr:cytochrome c [Aequorivita viscosa]SDW78751.1 nitric oxide reductase subunit C [Aequorivita viscosa]SHJ13644.1 nitric oxide reductase, NorC subunit apoprotein [Aequorivita viscosa]
MPVNSKPYLYAIAFLLVTFGLYNYVVYTTESYIAVEKLSPQAVKGQQLFQSNRCWSCHQLYGLGGYLGPDLTNVFSDEKKGPLYIKAFLNSGVKSMPQFNFNEEEKEAIVAYLKQVDETGIYPNYDAKIEATGWVKLKYRNE